MFLKRLARIFTRKKPSEPKPPPRDHLAEALLTRHIPLQKGSIEDIFAFCQETRKTLKIFKQAVIDLYVQWGNLEDKIEKYIATRDPKDHEKAGDSGGD